jgi:hypothetical protein
MNLNEKGVWKILTRIGDQFITYRIAFSSKNEGREDAIRILKLFFLPYFPRQDEEEKGVSYLALRRTSSFDATG